MTISCDHTMTRTNRLASDQFDEVSFYFQIVTHLSVSSPLGRVVMWGHVTNAQIPPATMIVTML